MLQATMQAVDIQDRDGAAMLLAALFGLFRFLLKVYADRGYQPPEFDCAVAARPVASEAKIVKRSDQATALAFRPTLVIERTLGLAGGWLRIGRTST